MKEKRLLRDKHEKQADQLGDYCSARTGVTVAEWGRVPKSLLTTSQSTEYAIRCVVHITTLNDFLQLTKKQEWYQKPRDKCFPSFHKQKRGKADSRN